MVQWLRLHAPNAGGLGSIPGQGTINKSHMPQLKILHAATKKKKKKKKIPHATTKDPACHNEDGTFRMPKPRYKAAK